MTAPDGHYARVVGERKSTRFVRCGFRDRFDPFVLNKTPRVHDLYASLFARYLPQPTVDRLLDVGCGSGVYFDALAPHARSIEATDPSESMVAIAREYCEAEGLNHVHVSAGNGEGLAFPSDHFDAAMAFDMLHHAEKPDVVLAEIRRTLKPGGVLLVFEPNILNPLMFFAHALPREERMALARNRPSTLRRTLERHFETLRWDGACDLVTEVSGWRRHLLDAYLACWRTTRLANWYPRQVWLGRKRP